LGRRKEAYPIDPLHGNKTFASEGWKPLLGVEKHKDAFKKGRREKSMVRQTWKLPCGPFEKGLHESPIEKIERITVNCHLRMGRGRKISSWRKPYREIFCKAYSKSNFWRVLTFGVPWGQ